MVFLLPSKISPCCLKISLLYFSLVSVTAVSVVTVVFLTTSICVRILHSVWLVASHVLIPTKVTLVARQGGHSTKPQGPPRPPVQLPGGQRWCPNTRSPHPSLSSLLLPVLYLTLHQGRCGRHWPNGQMQSSTHQNLTPTLQPSVCEGGGPLLPGSLYVPPTVKELPYPR